MVEKDLEQKLISALESLDIPSAQTIGSWCIGEVVRNVEEDNAAILISTTVSPRQYDTAQIPTANIECMIAIDGRIEEDPTGEMTIGAADAVMDLLQHCQEDLWWAADVFKSDDFDVAGFRLDGGSGLQKNGQGNTWNINLNFTLRGVITR